MWIPSDRLRIGWILPPALKGNSKVRYNVFWSFGLLVFLKQLPVFKMHNVLTRHYFPCTVGGFDSDFFDIHSPHLVFDSHSVSVCGSEPQGSSLHLGLAISPPVRKEPSAHSWRKKKKNDPNIIIHVILAQNHPAETKHNLGRKTCSWNHTVAMTSNFISSQNKHLKYQISVNNMSGSKCFLSRNNWSVRLWREITN